MGQELLSKCSRNRELVYSGRAGGSHYNNPGGGAERLYLPPNPDYISDSRSMNPHFSTTIHGAEYHSRNGPLHNLQDQNLMSHVLYAIFQSEL